MPNKEQIAKGSRSNNGQRPKGKPKQGEFRFVNVAFTEDVKKRCLSYLQGNPDVWQHVETLVGQGYRIGLGLDAKNDAYSASLTNRDAAVEFRNSCITVRGGTAWDALSRLVGLHFGVANEDWSAFEAPNEVDDLW